MGSVGSTSQTSYGSFSAADTTCAGTPTTAWSVETGKCIDCSSNAAAAAANAVVCSVLRSQYGRDVPAGKPADAQAAIVTGIECAHSSSIGYMTVQWYADAACGVKTGEGSKLSDQEMTVLTAMQQTPAPAPCLATSHLSTRTTCNTAPSASASSPGAQPGAQPASASTTTPPSLRGAEGSQGAQTASEVVAPLEVADAAAVPSGHHVLSGGELAAVVLCSCLAGMLVVAAVVRHRSGRDAGMQYAQHRDEHDKLEAGGGSTSTPRPTSHASATDGDVGGGSDSDAAAKMMENPAFTPEAEAEAGVDTAGE